MKNDRFCFNKSVVMLVIVFLFLGTTAFVLSQLPRNQTITSTRAEAPYILGGVVNTNGCYEYNNSSRCTQDCKKSHGNQYQCSGTTSLFCCQIKPTPSPIITEGFTQKIMSFKLSNEQKELLDASGFTPINFVPSEISNQMIDMSGFPNDIYVYDKDNEGGIYASGFKGKILSQSNVTMLGLLSVTPSDHDAYLVQVLYLYGKDKEYLMSFYDKGAQQYYNKFKQSVYYTTNVRPNIKSYREDDSIYFPITTQFLSCQNKNIYSTIVTESCLVFGYKEVSNGYIFEYHYLDLR